MPRTGEAQLHQTDQNRLPCTGYAALAAGEKLAPWEFTRRTPRPRDVLVEISHCGVCHTDLHFARNDFGISVFPLVPGHEIIGRVKAVGTWARKFNVGDTVGIGCMVDSCRDCENCRRDLEQFCVNQATYTYSLPDRQGDGVTYGGYSNLITCHEDFALRVSANQPLAKVAPLLCAGITMYSPLRHWKVGAGQKIAILGLGGLGHMGVKFAAAMGADVTVLSTSLSKEEDARRLGARTFVNTNDQEQLNAVQGAFDLIVDTVPFEHDYNLYLSMLRVRGTMVLVGLPTAPAVVPSPSLVFFGRNLSGSLIGGLSETQEMLDFCAARNITADVETIRLQDINVAFDRMERNDVKYRFVIDMSRR
jgi:uncharacterized zinc-type alcohol dehydrogenase-like protein